MEVSEELGQDDELMMNAPHPEMSTSFTSLLELPPTQVVKLLHSNSTHHEPYFPAPLNSPQNAAAIPSHQLPRPISLTKVKKEDEELLTHSGSDSDHSSPSSLPDSTPLAGIQKSAKRKEPEKKKKKKTKTSKATKSKKVKSTEDKEQLPYVHVRARRGQATDSHSLAERARREKINARMKLLQELVPGCSKISGIALVLDEIINHVQALQRQVEFLSMRLAAVNPRIDVNLENFMAEENGSFVDDGNFLTLHQPLEWSEPYVNGFRQLFHSQWQCNAYQQPVWFKEENHHDFVDTFLNHDTSPESAKGGASMKERQKACGLGASVHI